MSRLTAGLRTTLNTPARRSRLAPFASLAGSQLFLPVLVRPAAPTHVVARAARAGLSSAAPTPSGYPRNPFISTVWQKRTVTPRNLRKMASTAEDAAALIESSKRLAAYQAVKDHLRPEYTRIGIGSGSTVVYVVEAIAALGPSVTSKMAFYPTGAQSEELIEEAKLNLQYISKLPAGQQLDVAFDGADEVDDDMNLIKGGGACLWQEKIVAASAKQFVCVADFRKLSGRLGTAWKKGIPIEVLPMAAPRVLDELRRMGSENPRIRPGLPGKAGAIVTDNGMWIIDAPFAPLLLRKDTENDKEAGKGANGVWAVEALADKLIKIPGVAEIGLFYGSNGLEVASGAQKPVAAYFGMADGTVEIKTPGA